MLPSVGDLRGHVLTGLCTLLSSFLVAELPRFRTWPLNEQHGGARFHSVLVHGCILDRGWMDIGPLDTLRRESRQSAETLCRERTSLVRRCNPSSAAGYKFDNFRRSDYGSLYVPGSVHIECMGDYPNIGGSSGGGPVDRISKCDRQSWGSCLATATGWLVSETGSFSLAFAAATIVLIGWNRGLPDHSG